MTTLRIILCGSLVGSFWTAVSVPLVAFLGQDLLQHLKQGLGAGDGLSAQIAFVAANLIAGCCAMAVYYLARLRPMGREHAVSLATLLWWLLAQQQSLKWVLVLGIPMSNAWALVATSLPAMALCLYVGARMLDRASGLAPVRSGSS